MADYATEQNFRLAQKMLEQQGEIKDLTAERDALKAELAEANKSRLHRDRDCYWRHRTEAAETELAEARAAIERIRALRDQWHRKHAWEAADALTAVLDAVPAAAGGTSHDKASIERARALHSRTDDSDGRPCCRECDRSWPCPTLRALAALDASQHPEDTREPGWLTYKKLMGTEPPPLPPVLEEPEDTRESTDDSTDDSTERTTVGPEDARTGVSAEGDSQ